MTGLRLRFTNKILYIEHMILDEDQEIKQVI